MKYLGRQPSAPLLKANAYKRLSELPPVTECTAYSQSCSVSVEDTVHLLKEHLRELNCREKELRKIYLTALASDDGSREALATIVDQRQELAEEIAFLWRAYKVGFNEDSLTIAVVAALKTDKHLSELLNSFRDHLKQQLELTLSGKLSFFLC